MIKRMEYKWQVLMVVIFGSFMVVLDATIVNVTIPTFEQVFHTDVNGIQWVLTGYLLALGIITPVAGYLADNFGIKKVYLLSIGFFVIGSALCGLSDVIKDASGHPFIGTLIAFRILQGIGGGAAIPLGNAQLFSAFPPEERGLANGVFGVPLLVAPALGPTLGGYIAEYLHWSLIFYINVPVGIAGILMGMWLLKPSAPRRSERFDASGFISATIGLALLLFALSEAGTAGWGDPIVLVSFAVSGAILLYFVIVELRRDDAILDIRLYRNKVFALGSIINWATVIALFASAFLLPLYLQNVRGQSPFQAGLMLLPQALTAAAAVTFTGRLYDKIGPRVLVVIGLIVLAATSWYFTQISDTSDFLTIEILLALRGLALACTVQPSVTTALNVVERRALPRGSSLVNSSRQVIQAFGIAILSTILSNQIASYFAEASARHARPDANIAFIQGFNGAFLFVFVVALVGVAVGFFMPGKPGEWPLRRPAGVWEETRPVEVGATRQVADGHDGQDEHDGRYSGKAAKEDML